MHPDMVEHLRKNDPAAEELPAMESAEEVAVKAPEPPPPPPKPTKISAEDKLKAEILDLKMKNVQLQLQLMQGELEKAMNLRGGYVKEIEELRKHFIDTYGVDLAMIRINPDGSFMPINGAPSTIVKAQ